MRGASELKAYYLSSQLWNDLGQWLETTSYRAPAQLGYRLILSKSKEYRVKLLKVAGLKEELFP